MGYYDSFCDIIRRSFFSENLKGEYVSMVVDEDFISSACKEMEITEEDLILNIKSFMFSYPLASLKKNKILSLGVIALQNYVTALRGDSTKGDASAYRRILCKLLKIDEATLADWFSTYQQDFWGSFYQWCEENDFKVYEVKVSTGPWRYVRYMLSLAGSTLNKRDLISFGYTFYFHGLHVKDEISEVDFWNILGRYNYMNISSRSQKIMNETATKATYAQIYNFFCNEWDGSYIDKSSLKKKYTPSSWSNDLHLLYSEDESCFVIYDDDYNRINTIPLNSLSRQALEIYIRTNNTIVFKKSQVYNGFWESTRVIDDSDEGLVLLFSSLRPSFNHERIFVSDKYRLIRIYKDYTTSKFFSKEKKPFVLEGGLKCGYLKYLAKGEPLLRITRATTFWLGGKAYEGEEGSLYILELSEGEHIIKFPGYSPVYITICDDQKKDDEEAENDVKWVINPELKKDSKIGIYPIKVEDIGKYNSFYGIDFNFCYKQMNPDKSVLNRWINAQEGVYQRDEKNIVIKMLKQSI